MIVIPAYDEDGNPIVCEGCKVAILAGEARYTGGESATPPRYWHWNCHDKWLSVIEDQAAKFPLIRERIKPLIAKLRKGPL